jgi:hypothetical protein
MRRHLLVRAIFTAIVLLAGLLESALAQRPGATLASPGAGIWWDSRSAPARWDAGLPGLTRSVQWHSAASSIEWAELDIEVNGGPLRVHTILARLDPGTLRADLVQLTDASRARGAWTVDSAGPDILLAVNAGQFAEAGPWGWLVRDHRELAPPGRGPLAAAVAFDSAGRLAWLDGPAISRARGPGRPVTAFQSYPRILAGGLVPPEVRDGRGVDPAHRDTRLAIGQLRDGRVLIALTRFGLRENAVARIPIGLTVPEMAALMGALGCADAVMLDGGLSAQLMLRDKRSEALIWRGSRKVPVALVFRDR